MQKIFQLCLPLLLLFSATTLARTYVSPVLDEAHKLLTISPNQSLNIAEQFLSSRDLIASTDRERVLTRDGNGQDVRTPTATIEAMSVMALAYFEIGSQKLALKTLDDAYDFAKKYSNRKQQINTRLLQAQLLWKLNHNLQQVTPLLEDITQGLEKENQKLTWTLQLNYELSMLHADMYAYLGDETKTQAAFDEAKNYLSALGYAKLNIDFHLRYGQYYLSQNKYDDALKQLLTTYWTAVKEGDSVELARTNFLLAQLFYSRHVFDKAIEHATEAADFYNNYPYSKPLSNTINLMADTYFKQGRFNLALVNYLNVLDNELYTQPTQKVIQLRLDIANTYLKLYDFNHAETYLYHAQKMIKDADYPHLKAQMLLLKSALALHDDKGDQALKDGKAALELTLSLNDQRLTMQAYQTVSSAYEQQKDFQHALNAEKQYQQLWLTQQHNFNAVNEDIFRQQKDIIEKSIHYAGLEDNIAKLNREFLSYQQATIASLIVTFILFLLLLRRGYLNRKMREELETQTVDLYSHARSGLQNLKLLNTKLPSSLKQSSAMFEQWRLGELINEPLSDRLHFVMIDMPFLGDLYLKQGYLAGLEVEKQLGKHIRRHVNEPARIYHFSDTLFLYIEPKRADEQTPEKLFNEIQSWLDDFDIGFAIEKKIKVGVAEYPFLPRAYTAINDKELIDILLMAIYLARKIAKHHPEQGSQWVHLSAIENAPAASFASNNIRHACQLAVEQGLMKIQTSQGNEDFAKDVLRNQDL